MSQQGLNSQRLTVFGKQYSTPTELHRQVKSASAGQNHLIFITNNYEVYALGSNRFGQLGIATSTLAQCDKPQRILEGMKIKNVFCGAEDTFLINQKNEVYSTGLNIKGQLGLGTFQNMSTPKLVIGLLPYGKKNPKSLNPALIKQPKAPIIGILEQFDLQVKMDQDPLQSILILQPDEFIETIACGALFTIALSNKNKVYSCGFQCTNFSSQSNDQFFDQSKFKQMQFDVKIVQISAGLSGGAALSKEGFVYIWGKFGKITHNIPKKVIRSSNSLNDKPEQEQYINVKVGDEFVLLLTKKGEVYSFGYNIDNQLGVDSRQIAFREEAERVPDLFFLGDIEVGRNSCFAVSLDKNQLIGWGSNRYGQISSLPQDSIVMKPTYLGIVMEKHDRIIASSYQTYILSNKKLQIVRSLNKINELANQEQETVKISEYKKLLNDYQVLKNLNLILLERVQPNKKETKQVQTSSKFQVTGVTKHRKFNTNLEIEWNELTLESQINEGGYGIIYKAKWRQTSVAVKKFKIENGDVSVRDFLSECHAMEAVRHPNIVMFLGAVIKSPNYSIVLEYCSKGSLWSYLQNTDILLSWEQRRRMAKQIARGVLYLHLCNPPIIHRDLKSLNIFLDSHYTVKIGDFGWTKTLDEYMTNKIGTYQWMAPQVIGSQPYSQKVDVFSYSIILWQIASREPPYKNINGTKVSEGVLHNQLRPTIPKKTPEPFARLMKRCWETDPNKRPNFREIVQELEIMKL